MEVRARFESLSEGREKLMNRLRPLFGAAALILYPRRCPYCRQALSADRFLCRQCRDRVPYIKDPFCYQCGKPVSSPEQELCYDCRSFHKSFKRGLALFLYDDFTRIPMAAFKYHNRRILADYYVMEILSHHRDILRSWQIQAIIPVPIHKSKQKSRGYNQAELLARTLSRRLGIPCYKDFLIRSIDTPPQKNFSPQARLNNLARAFTLNPRYRETAACSLRRILLIDDIYTTGSTMEICTRVLLEAGIPDIYIYSVCIGISRD